MLVAQSLIKQNSNRRMLSLPPKRNSWPHVMSAACHCSSAASCGTIDNDGCTAMGNTQKPTTRTRHINIKYFALCEWIERDLIHLERIDTLINIAVLFYWHTNFLLGHVPPKNLPVYQHAITTYGDHCEEDIDRFLPGSFTTPVTAKAARISAPTHDDVRGNPWLIVLLHE